MATHPLWRPYVVLSPADIATARVIPVRARVRVPGLWAKPVIDLDLVVEDSAAHDDDRERYGALKRSLTASQTFNTVADYNNAKAALIYGIYERIFAADAEHAHDPHPRGNNAVQSGSSVSAEQ